MTLYVPGETQDGLAAPGTYRWATVTDTAPLTIRLDGDQDPLPVTPDTLVDPTTLKAGRRVWVQFFGRRLIVVGAAPDPAPPVYDTGWVDVTLNSANFLAYATGNEPRVRRIGSIVYFQGAVKPANATTVTSVDGAGTYSTNNICTIPAGFRVPSDWDEPTWVCQGSGDDRWSLRVYADGQVIAHRYGPGTPSTSSWLPFNVSWTID
jgi:hypothetical protein